MKHGFTKSQKVERWWVFVAQVISTWCVMIFCLIVLGVLLTGHMVEHFPTAEGRDNARDVFTWSLFLATSLLCVGLVLRPWWGTKPKTSWGTWRAELFAIVFMIYLLFCTSFTDLCYFAKLFGRDYGAMVRPDGYAVCQSDSSVILMHDVIVAAAHYWIPVRWSVLWPSCETCLPRSLMDSDVRATDTAH